jgi:hypothetical protein
MTEVNKQNQGSESALPQPDSTEAFEEFSPVESTSAKQRESVPSSETEQPPTSGKTDDMSALTQEFIDRLTQEERMLILLQSELYENSWLAMVNDLRNRLDGKPYIFKLASRIQDDIARIEKLQSFEREHNVKLSDFIKPP